MMLSLVLAVFVAPPPSLCFFAVNLTSYQEGRKGENAQSLLALTGIASSNSTCNRARYIALSRRTKDMKWIKDRTSFDHPGYSLCLAGVDYDGEGSSFEKY